MAGPSGYPLLGAMPASFQGASQSPVAPASTSAFAMQGFGAVITPVWSGRVFAILQATLNAAAVTVGIGIALQGYYGPTVSGTALPANTGTIPANAIAFGPATKYATGVTLTTYTDSFENITVSGLVLGLTIGQQYWFDVAAESIVTASDCQLINAQFTLIEL